MTLPERPQTGFAHLVASTKFSFYGFLRMCREAAFRQELAFGAILLALHLWLASSVMHFVAAVILVLLLLAAEALNTAVEEIVDYLTTDFHQFAKHAKDAGSFAVFCMISANTIFALAAVGQHFGLWGW